LEAARNEGQAKEDGIGRRGQKDAAADRGLTVAKKPRNGRGARGAREMEK